MLKWDENIYGVGVPELDSQHQKLFKLINDMMERFQQGERHDALSEAAVELVGYSNEHFAYEEKFMESIGFPYLDSHKRQHAGCKKKIREYLLRLKSGKPVSYFEILAFLQEWVENHIAQDDGRYAEYFKSNAQKKENKSAPA